MTTNFPSSIDAFTNPTSADTLDNPPHDQQHADINDAMEAVQTSLLDGAPLHIDDANERVGIGTTTPSTTLHVAGSILSDDSVTIGSGGEYVAGSIYSDANWGMILRAKQDSPLQAEFRIANSADTERLRIDNSGNVGIGTTTPNNTLEVMGDLFVGDTSRTYSGHPQYGGVAFPRGEIMFSNTNGQNQLYLASNLTMNSTGNSGTGAFETINTGVSGFIGIDNGGVAVGTAASTTAGAEPTFNIGVSVTNAGHVSMPNQPRVSGYANIGGSYFANSNYVMSNLLVNVGGGYNTSTGVYTVPESGTYMMSVSALSSPAPGYGYYEFKKGGVVVAYTHFSHDGPWENSGGTVLINCVAGDFLEIYIRVTGGNVGVYPVNHNCGLIMKVA